MGFLPIFYDLSQRPCLVVGAGEIAARKIRQLRKTAAEVLVVAPTICPELKTLAEKGLVEYRAERFSTPLLNDRALVISATDDPAVNAEVSRLCKKRHIPVNVVDVPELCSFIMPAIVDRGSLQIAVSTGGGSPVLARLLKTKLETLIPASYGRLAKLAERFRGAIRERYPDIQRRRRFWEDVLQGPVADMIHCGQETTAMDTMEQIVRQGMEVEQTGEVYLVGAGPGDPDLLTFRALRLMQQAEVVLYDRLVTPAIMELVRKDAERFYVGKKADQHTLHQTEINQLLVRLAKQGKRVLRLKGGDPFIFGRGGEEIESLSAENIRFQVVPGITAAAGCASYAGIPLTHRDYAHTCVFITGHLKDGSMELNWNTLLQPKQTIAVYMGVAGLDFLSQGLIERGMPKTMPAAMVQQGTTYKQRVYISELGELSSIAKRYDVQPPTIVIIGEVVSLHKQLHWFKPEEADQRD